MHPRHTLDMSQILCGNKIPVITHRVVRWQRLHHMPASSLLSIWCMNKGMLPSEVAYFKLLGHLINLTSLQANLERTDYAKGKASSNSNPVFFVPENTASVLLLT